MDGESHYFLGKRYLLRVIEHNAPPRVELKGKTKIYLYVRLDSSLEKKEEVMSGWYRSSLKNVGLDLIVKWKKIIGKKVKEYSVRKMRTRWGTCNRDQKKVCLNLELAKKPEHCIEYIIVHEMVHLLEKNHTDKFKAYMNKFMPKWRLYKEELNKSLLGDVKWKY